MRLWRKTFRDTSAHLGERYLELLKSSLLNEIYIENDVRLLYIFSTMSTNAKFDFDTYRNISVRLKDWVDGVRDARREGRIWWRVTLTSADGTQEYRDLRNECQFEHTMIGRKRLDNIQSCLAIVRDENVPGDLAETGVWRGGASIFMKGCLTTWDMRDRIVWAADSFEGLPPPTMAQDAGHDFSSATAPILSISLEEVQENFRRYNLLDGNVRFLKGWFRDTLHVAPIRKLAMLRLDGDLYESTMDALNALYDKVSPGGFVIVDDYGDFAPCRQAIHDFRGSRSIKEPLEEIDWTGVYWRKSKG